jgi:hypothetical protein
MSFVKDFKELHIGLRTTIITIICQIPFFFVSIYLLRYDLIGKVSMPFIASLDFYFIVCLCFCFSVIWFFINVASTWFAIVIAEKITKVDSEPHELYIASMIYSIMYLAIIMVDAISCGWGFIKFLYWAYGFIIFRLIWAVFWTWILKKAL